MKNEIVSRKDHAIVDTTGVPALFAPNERASRRFIEFFTANIRNVNTRRAYANAVRDFVDWCEERGIHNLEVIQPVHIAAHIEELGRSVSKPTVKQHLAAIRMLFDWLVVGQVMPSNPASVVRGPKYVVKKGKTPVLAGEEARQLLEAIDTSTLIGLRDRALLGMMVYTFARVGAVLGMHVEDHYIQGRRGWVRLHEKGGKRHEMPCHHNLEEFLDAYIAAGGFKEDRKGVLFRTVRGRTGQLSETPMSQADVYRMIQRRADNAGLKTRIGCHTWRATGITQYLKNGGKLEIAQRMAAHESARTTGLYDRRDDQVALDEVERISLT